MSKRFSDEEWMQFLTTTPIDEESYSRRVRIQHRLRRRLDRLPHGVRHTILRPAFWLGMTLGFPIEHLIWERLWPFDLITRWLGL